MAFAIDRNEAARRLSVSTRTVDRHIQGGRIRTKRIGKKMYLHEDDVENLRLSEVGEDEEEFVVVDKEQKAEPEIVHREKQIAPQVHKENGIDYSTLYRDAQQSIIKKDELIQDLAYRLGKSEAELKNSIPLVEYKKATFLLESAKTKTDSDSTMLSGKIHDLEKEVWKRNSYILWLATLLIIVITFSLVVFFYSRFIPL
jgi:excisionase family DNA binding protein